LKSGTLLGVVKYSDSTKDVLRFCRCQLAQASRIRHDPVCVHRPPIHPELRCRRRRPRGAPGRPEAATAPVRAWANQRSMVIAPAGTLARCGALGIVPVDSCPTTRPPSTTVAGARVVGVPRKNSRRAPVGSCGYRLETILVVQSAEDWRRGDAMTITNLLAA